MDGKVKSVILSAEQGRIEPRRGRPLAGATLVAKTPLSRGAIFFFILLALSASFVGCSATSLRCGTDGDSSFVELYGAPQHVSQATRQFSELCGFAYDQEN